MRLVTECDECDLSLCVISLTLSIMYDVVYLSVIYFLVLHYCVLNVVSCMMIVTWMFTGSSLGGDNQRCRRDFCCVIRAATGRGPYQSILTLDNWCQRWDRHTIQKKSTLSLSCA